MTSLDFKPDWFSKPGDTLASLMARKDLTAYDVALSLGRDTTFVSGLLAGIHRIDDDVACTLAACVGGSKVFWTTRQRQFDEALSNVASDLPRDTVKAWLRQLPLKHMKESGWLGGSTEHSDAEAALAYFDVNGPEEWRLRYTSFANEFAFRTSPTYESKLGALAAWLRQAVLKAETVRCSPWNLEGFRSALGEARALTRVRSPGSFIPKLRSLCSAHGVAIVFVQAPPGCRASGATKFLGPGKAMLALSFRYLSDDHFWFSFFHEAGHLVLHDPKDTYVDGGEAGESEREHEADAFAANYLIPPEQMEALVRIKPRAKDVIKFAMRLGISPGIVVGQMQHHKLIAPQQLNSLKRRYTRDELALAAS